MPDSNYWTRFAGRRLSRRDFVARGAVIGAGTAGIVLVGCSSSKNNNAAATRSATQAATAAGAATSAASAASPSAATAASPSAAAANPAAGAVVNGTYGKPSGMVQTKDPPKTRGGVYRTFGYNALPTDSYDPHQTTFGPMSTIHALTFSRIVSYADPIEQALEPDLAATIPEQPDKLTYIVKVNPAAKWASKVPIAPNNPIAGQPVTAADIKYSIDRQTNKQSPKAGAFYRSSDWEHIDKIEQPDDHTLRLTTKLPFAPMFNVMAGEFAFMLSPKIVDQAKDEVTGPDKLIGSGPFVLETFEALKEVRVSRNPDWFLKDAGFAPGRPFIDAWSDTFQPQDDNSVEGGFKAKQVDGTGWNDQTNAARVSKQNPGVVLTQEPTQGSIVMGMGVTYGPFKDVRLRQAISIAWDRQELGNAISAGFYKFSPPIGWFMTRWALPQDELLKRPGYRYANQADRDADIKQAKQLFDAAGGQAAFSGGLNMWYPNTPSYLPAYFPQLQKNFKDTLGLTFNGTEDDTGYTKIIAVLNQHKMDWYFGYDNGALDLDDWVKVNRTGSPYNFFLTSDPDLDAMLDKQQQEFDLAARQQLGYAIQRKMMDQAYFFLRPWNGIGNGTHWSYVRNTYHVPWFAYDNLLANLWLDSTDPNFQGRPS